MFWEIKLIHITTYSCTGDIVCVEGKHAVQGTFVLKTAIVVTSHLWVLVNVVHVKPYINIKSKNTYIPELYVIHMQFTSNKNDKACFSI